MSLTDEETEQYEEITQKIIAIADSAEHDPALRERLQKLLLQRARIVSLAQQKMPALLDLLSRLQEEYRQRGDEPTGILIYCSLPDTF